MNHSASPTEAGTPEQASPDDAPFGALVLGRLPIVRSGIAAVIREVFGAQARVLSAGWAERQRALAVAASGRLDLAIVLPERAALLVDWPAFSLAVPGAAVVVAVPGAELPSRRAATPAAVGVIPLGATLAKWGEYLRAATLAARGARNTRARAPARAAPTPLQPARMSLTQRQREVYGMLSLGYSNKDIAMRLGVAVGTVKLHVGAVLQALQARNRVDLLLRHTGAVAEAAGERFGIHGAVLRRPIPLTSEDA